MERLNKRTNDLYRDVCLAQTTHPEMANKFKQFSEELCALDLRFTEGLKVLGHLRVEPCQSKNCKKEDTDKSLYQKKFCLSQTMKLLVKAVKYHKVREMLDHKKSETSWYSYFDCRRKICTPRPTKFVVELTFSDLLSDRINHQPNGHPTTETTNLPLFLRTLGVKKAFKERFRSDSMVLEYERQSDAEAVCRKLQRILQ